MNELTDAQLVAAIVAGRRDAFAALYDRYGAALYDVAMSMLRDPHDAADAVQDVFVIAAQRLHQLREPERVRAWLFSVLRHDVYRRSSRRRRTTPTETIADRAAPAMPEDAGGRLEYEDLARLVRDAAEGLDDRDRLVLELSVRQGLQGADLAAALGVSPEQSYSLVFRMRERTERALGALVVARTNREACRDLDELLRDWDGRFSVLVRKRVSRHVDQCATCEPSRKKVGALVAFGAAPAWAAPLALRERVVGGFGPGAMSKGGGSGEAATPRLASVDGARAEDLDWAPDGFPGAARAARRGLVALVAGVVIVLVVGVLGALALRDDDPSTLVAGAVENRDTTTTEAATTGGSDPTTSTSATAAAGTAAPSTSSAPGAPLATNSPTTSNPAASGPATTVVTPAGPPTPTAPPTTGTTPPPTAPPTTGAPTTTAAGPRLSVTPGRLDAGASTVTTTFSVRNDGDRALTWSVAVTAGPVSAQPPSGTLAPGTSAPVTVTIDRTRQAEGPFNATLAFGGNGGSASVTVAGRAERGPTVSITTSPSPLTTMYTPSAGCVPVTASISATVTDESAISAVTLHWRAPGSATSTSTAMALRADRYVAPLGPFGTGGTVEWWVRAVDSRGNVTTTPLRSTPVGATCIR